MSNALEKIQIKNNDLKINKKNRIIKKSSHVKIPPCSLNI